MVATSAVLLTRSFREVPATRIKYSKAALTVELRVVRLASMATTTLHKSLASASPTLVQILVYCSFFSSGCYSSTWPCRRPSTGRPSFTGDLNMRKKDEVIAQASDRMKKSETNVHPAMPRSPHRHRRRGQSVRHRPLQHTPGETSTTVSRTNMDRNSCCMASLASVSQGSSQLLSGRLVQEKQLVRDLSHIKNRQTDRS